MVLSISELAPLELDRPIPHSMEVYINGPNMQPKLDYQHFLSRIVEERHNAMLAWMHVSSTQARISAMHSAL